MVAAAGCGTCWATATSVSENTTTRTRRSCRRSGSIRATRARTSISHTLFQTGSYAEALNAIAIGLASDVKGQYRETLLQKQQQIVASISARAAAEQERMTRLPAGT